MGKSHFGAVSERALVERDEGLAEGVADLRGAPMEDRVRFLREVPSAKGAIVDDLLADIRALEKGGGSLAEPVREEGRDPSARRKGGGMLGLLAGLLLGGLAGAGGLWYAATEGVIDLGGTVQTIVVQTPAPPPSPPPASRWTSPEEESLYLRFSQANGGMALVAHCRGDGKVEVEVAGGRRNACLAWPAAE